MPDVRLGKEQIRFTVVYLEDGNVSDIRTVLEQMHLVHDHQQALIFLDRKSGFERARQVRILSDLLGMT